MANKKVLHKRSSVDGKAPTSEQLDFGELAINYSKDNEQLYIKNSNEEIVPLLETSVIVSVEEGDPLTLTATPSANGKSVELVGSVDAYDKSTIDDKLVSIVSGGTITLEGYLKKTEAAETYQPIGDYQKAGTYLTSFNTSGVSPLTLTSSTDSDGKTTLLGSVDLSGKQNKLTAGDNINIDENNVISTKILPFDEIYNGSVPDEGYVCTSAYRVVYVTGSHCFYAVATNATTADGPIYVQWDADGTHASSNEYHNGDGYAGYPYEWKIYSCDGILYTWNGSDLVPFGNLSEDGLRLLSYRYKYTHTYNFLENVKSLFTSIPTYVSIHNAQIMDVAKDENSCRVRITCAVGYNANVNFLYVTLGNYTVAVCPPFNRASASYVSFDLVLQIVDGEIRFPNVYAINITIYQGGVIGDAVFYDNVNDNMIFVKSENISVNNYPLSRYTPIGVVAIPATHDVYGTGECGVVSLKFMSCNTPNEGSTGMENIYWGYYADQVGTTLYNSCVQTGTTASPTAEATAATSYPYMPSDNFSSSQCPTDPDAYYYNSSSSYNAAPSPYLEDGSRNPVYYQTTDPCTTANCLSDFDGVGGTQLMLDNVTVSDWKTSDTIANSYNSGNYPAACCCWRYYTTGTSQGDWYLPACGELGYVLVRQDTIDKTISALIDAYGSDIGATIYQGHISSYYMATCSEYSSTAYRTVSFGDGSAGWQNKITYDRVRAFYRVKVLS